MTLNPDRYIYKITFNNNDNAHDQKSELYLYVRPNADSQSISPTDTSILPDQLKYVSECTKQAVEDALFNYNTPV